MRTHHALQPRTPEQASYSIGRRDGKQFLKLYRSYLHGTLAGTREPVYEGTVVESANDWRLTAVLALAPMTLAFAYLIVMLFSVFPAAGLSFLYKKPAPDFPDKKLSVRFDSRRALPPRAPPLPSFFLPVHSF